MSVSEGVQVTESSTLTNAFEKLTVAGLWQAIAQEALEFAREGWTVLQQAIGANVVRERRTKQKKMIHLNKVEVAEEVEGIVQIETVSKSTKSKVVRELEDEGLLIDTLEVKQLHAKDLCPKKLVLCLRVICARDLEAMDMGGTSDPYVTIALGDHRLQSSIIKKDLHPVWEQDFDAVVHDWSIPLKVSVWDHDGMSADDVIGETSIWLEDIAEDIRHDGSKNLHSPAKLSVTVLRAKNLIAADRGGTSDPYVRLHLGTKPASGYATAVKKKTLNPEWDQTFHLDVGKYERKEVLTVECFDKDAFGSDDSLGKFCIELASLPLQDEPGSPIAQWHSFDKRKGVVNKGQIELRYALVRIEEPPDLHHVGQPVKSEMAIEYRRGRSKSSGSNDLFDQIGTNYAGVVDDEEFRRYLASNPTVQPSSNVVRLSGMMLHSGGGVVRPYSGINGDYQLSNRVVNYRQVYLRLPRTTVPGGAAMWWANNSGKLCWVIGPAEAIGSEKIWAYIESTHTSPEHSHGAWHVYSYDSLSYEPQHDVHAHALRTTVSSPPMLAGGQDASSAHWANSQPTPPATPPPHFAIAEETSELPGLSAAEVLEELSRLQARYKSLEMRLHSRKQGSDEVLVQLSETRTKMIELHHKAVRKSVSWFPLQRDGKTRGEIQLGFSFMELGESTACIDLQLDRSHHTTSVSAPSSHPAWTNELFKMVVDSDWARLRCTVLHQDASKKAKHILVVTVHRARKLLVMDSALFGAGSSDPYVTIKVGMETRKTAIVTKSLSPVWDETFQIPIWGDNDEKMLLSVWDYDAMSADDTIGEVTVPITGSLRSPLRKWFDITGEGKTTGEVELGIRIEDPLAHDVRLALVIKVVGARDLEAMDVGGSSDPYAVLKLGNQEHKTRIVQKNLSPVWNEEFTLSVEEIYQPVNVSVWDNDLIGADDMIGEVFVHLSEFVGRMQTQVWYDLKMGGRVRGQVLLSIMLTENRQAIVIVSISMFSVLSRVRVDL